MRNGDFGGVTSNHEKQICETMVWSAIAFGNTDDKIFRNLVGGDQDTLVERVPKLKTVAKGIM